MCCGTFRPLLEVLVLDKIFSMLFIRICIRFTMMVKILSFITIALLMVGCSMRPPSAGAFMAAYQSRSDSSGTVLDGSFSGYAAFSPKSGTTADDSSRLDSWNEVVGYEWRINERVNIYHFIDHFEIGCGLEFMNPYVTMGFASNHFGVMGWTDWGVFGAFFKKPGMIRGGVSLMEQIALTPKMHIGLTQFASRTRAYYWAGDDEFREPYPYSFIEYGGGTYWMYEVKTRLRVNLEFRYSYDVTFKGHRLALDLDLLMGVK